MLLITLFCVFYSTIEDGQKLPKGHFKLTTLWPKTKIRTDMNQYYTDHNI